MDELCAQLDISRNYCLNCGSWKTLPLSKLRQSVLGKESNIYHNNYYRPAHVYTMYDVYAFVFASCEV